MNLKSKSSLALAVLCVCTATLAETKAPEPDFTLSYNVGVVSDYRFRGISQTSTDPALQGGVDFAHKSGFYLGVWGSNIKWIKDYVSAADGSLEVDVYGGYKGEIKKDFTYDVGVISYRYPGNSAATNTLIYPVGSFADANTTEVYAALTYGLVTAKYSRATSNFIANNSSAGSQYLEIAATFDLGNGISLTPHLGRQMIPNVFYASGGAYQDGQGDYTDYSLTVAKDFGNGLTASVAALGTNANEVFYLDTKGKFLGKNGLSVGLKYSF